MFAPQGLSGWYIGYYGANCNLNSFATGLSADEVYVNFYLKGNDNTNVTLKAVEKVGSDNYPFTKPIHINWTGWQMVSVKMSDLRVGIPANVNSISLSAGTDIFNAEAECEIDFVIITKGKPFNGAN